METAPHILLQSRFDTDVNMVMHLYAMSALHLFSEEVVNRTPVELSSYIQ